MATGGREPMEVTFDEGAFSDSERKKFKPLRAIRRIFGKKRPKEIHKSTGSIFVKTFSETGVETVVEDDDVPGRVISLSHDSVFAPEQVILSAPDPGLIRHALSQDAINYVTVPVDELKTAEGAGIAMSIGSDLNDESVNEKNQDSNSNEKEQEPTITNEKIQTSSAKATSASTTVELNMDDLVVPVARLDNKAAYDKMAVRPKTRKAARKARGMQQHIHTATSHVNGFSTSSTTQPEHVSEDEEPIETSPQAKRSRPPILSISEDPREHELIEDAPAPKRYSMLGRVPGGPTMVVPSLADVQMVKLKKTPTFGDEKKPPAQSNDNPNARVARSLTSPSASPAQTQKKTKSDIFSKPKILRKKSSKTTKTESVKSSASTKKTEGVKVEEETVTKKPSGFSSPVKKRKERNNKNQEKAKDETSPSGFKGLSYFERVREEKKKAKKESETERNQSGNNSKPADSDSIKPEKIVEVATESSTQSTDGNFGKTAVDKENENKVTGMEPNEMGTMEQLPKKATVPESSKAKIESEEGKIKDNDNIFEKKSFEGKNIAKVKNEKKDSAARKDITTDEVRMPERPIPKPRRKLSPNNADEEKIKVVGDRSTLKQEDGCARKHEEFVSRGDKTTALSSLQKSSDNTDHIQETKDIVKTVEFTEPKQTSVSERLNQNIDKPKSAAETNIKSDEKDETSVSKEEDRKKDEDMSIRQSPGKKPFSVKPFRETGIPLAEKCCINHAFVKRQVSLEKIGEIKNKTEHKAYSQTPQPTVKKSEKSKDLHIVQEEDRPKDTRKQLKSPVESHIMDHTMGEDKIGESLERDFTPLKLKPTSLQHQRASKPAIKILEKGDSDTPKRASPVSSLSPVESAISIFGERRDQSVKLSSTKLTPARSFNNNNEKEKLGEVTDKTKQSAGSLKTPENAKQFIEHSDTRIDDQNNNVLKSGKPNISAQRKNSLTEKREPNARTDIPGRPRSKTEISSTKADEDAAKPSWVGMARRRSKLWEEKSLRPVKPLSGGQTTSKPDSENDKQKRPESLTITTPPIIVKHESPQMSVKDRENSIDIVPTQRMSPLTPSAILSPNRKNSIPDINGQQAKRQHTSPTKTVKESQSGKPAWLAIAMQKQKRWTKEEAI